MSCSQGLEIKVIVYELTKTIINSTASQKCQHSSQNFIYLNLRTNGTCMTKNAFNTFNALCIFNIPYDTSCVFTGEFVSRPASDW